MIDEECCHPRPRKTWHRLSITAKVDVFSNCRNLGIFLELQDQEKAFKNLASITAKVDIFSNCRNLGNFLDCRIKKRLSESWLSRTCL